MIPYAKERKEGKKGREGRREGGKERGKEGETRERPMCLGLYLREGGLLGRSGVVGTWLRRLRLSPPSPLRVGDILQSCLRVA